MNQFEKDVQLLSDLNSLVNEMQKGVNPSDDIEKLVETISPTLKVHMFIAKKKSKQQVDILIRVKTRLEELLSAETRSNNV